MRQAGLVDDVDNPALGVGAQTGSGGAVNVHGPHCGIVLVSKTPARAHGWPTCVGFEQRQAANLTSVRRGCIPRQKSKNDFW